MSTPKARFRLPSGRQWAKEAGQDELIGLKFFAPWLIFVYVYTLIAGPIHGALTGYATKLGALIGLNAQLSGNSVSCLLLGGFVALLLGLSYRHIKPFQKGVLFVDKLLCKVLVYSKIRGFMKLVATKKNLTTPTSNTVWVWAPGYYTPAVVNFEWTEADGTVWLALMFPAVPAPTGWGCGIVAKELTFDTGISLSGWKATGGGVLPEGVKVPPVTPPSALFGGVDQQSTPAAPAFVMGATSSPGQPPMVVPESDKEWTVHEVTEDVITGLKIIGPTLVFVYAYNILSGPFHYLLAAPLINFARLVGLNTGIAGAAYTSVIVSVFIMFGFGALVKHVPLFKKAAFGFDALLCKNKAYSKVRNFVKLEKQPGQDFTNTIWVWKGGYWGPASINAEFSVGGVDYVDVIEPSAPAPTSWAVGTMPKANTFDSGISLVGWKATGGGPLPKGYRLPPKFPPAHLFNGMVPANAVAVPMPADSTSGTSSVKAVDSPN